MKYQVYYWNQGHYPWSRVKYPVEPKEGITTLQLGRALIKRYVPRGLNNATIWETVDSGVCCAGTEMYNGLPCAYFILALRLETPKSFMNSLLKMAFPTTPNAQGNYAHGEMYIYEEWVISTIFRAFPVNKLIFGRKPNKFIKDLIMNRVSHAAADVTFESEYKLFLAQWKAQKLFRGPS